MIDVLVIDDDFMVARIHSSFIDRTDGFRTIATGHDAATAIDLAQLHQPDLILLDIYLPDRSGVDLLPDLRAHCPETDVMIISAARETETVRLSVRQGVVDYLLKPFTYEVLHQRLTSYAQRRQRLHEVDVRDQDDVDRALRGPDGMAQVPKERMPKGMSQQTAALVIGALTDTGGDLSASEAGQAIGVSRVSARRYLEWLVATGQAEVQLKYGSQGRPERRYRLRRR